MFEIKPLDRTSGKPVYAQIMDNIIEMIADGKLKYGSKLPPERELAELVGVSRGTIKKVYSELEKTSVINIVWGSGAYVVRKNSSTNDSAALYTVKLFQKLDEEGYSKLEAKSLLHIKQNKSLESGRINIALIDDCPELLTAFKKQAASINGAQGDVFLFEEAGKYKNKEAIFTEYDMVFATSENYRELLSMLGDTTIKPLRVYAAADRQTAINFLKVTDLGQIGILAKSREFKVIVNQNLIERGFRHAEADAIYDKWTDLDEFKKFIQNKSYLIMPPIDALDLAPDVYQAVFDFIGDGGSVIIFNYELDKSSVLYIEEIVSKLLYSMGE